MATILFGGGTALAQTTTTEDPRWDSSRCLGCHATANFSVDLPSGEELALAVDETAFAQSIHGASGIQCAHCHSRISGFPHPELTAETVREFAHDLYASCQMCHLALYSEAADRIHAAAVAGGDARAPVCSDCHDPHATATGRPAAQQAGEACTECHARPVAAPPSGIHAAPESLDAGDRGVDPWPIALPVAATALIVVTAGIIVRRRRRAGWKGGKTGAVR